MNAPARPATAAGQPAGASVNRRRERPRPARNGGGDLQVLSVNRPPWTPLPGPQRRRANLRALSVNRRRERPRPARNGGGPICRCCR
ncbi:hypothetical protein [Actinomadura sp. CNU-125]|uniref:hypothetical protein n=1 Tax=Actinomadura sp. CNU-125 TaxID=1904961 RepID=UPI0011789D43|nr:hypothetical protein [Actinomadura sp. CNU-125]